MPKKEILGRRKITIRELNVKKAAISGAVLFAILGLITGIVLAVPTILFNVGAGILLVIGGFIFGAIGGGLACGICVVAKNIALQVSDGLEIEFDLE